MSLLSSGHEIKRGKTTPVKNVKSTFPLLFGFPSRSNDLLSSILFFSHFIFLSTCARESSKDWLFVFDLVFSWPAQVTRHSGRLNIRCSVSRPRALISMLSLFHTRILTRLIELTARWGQLKCTRTVVVSSLRVRGAAAPLYGRWRSNRESWPCNVSSFFEMPHSRTKSGTRATFRRIYNLVIRGLLSEKEPPSLNLKV